MKVRLTDRVTVRWIAGGVAAALAAAGSLALFTGGEAPRHTATGTVRVQRGTVSTTVSAAGTAQPLQSRGLSFSVSGTVTELTVRAGDIVQAGATLARIDDTDVRSAVSAAQTQVDNAEEAVAKAKTSASQSTTGTGATTCAQAAAYGAGQATTLVVAATSSSPSPSATTSSPGTPTSGPTGGPQSTAPTGGTPRTGTSTRQGTCPTTGTGGTGTTGGAGSRGGSSTDSLFAAQQQLNNAIHTLNQQQTKLAGTVITAPVAGRVLSVGGVIGSTVSPSSSGFIVLAGTGDVAVRAQFTEAEVPKLATGQPVRITLPNLPDQEFTGTVTQIDPAGTVSNKLVRYAALIAFDKIPDTLLFGQTANVAVVTASASGVLSVPATAVTGRDGSTARVSVRTASGTERRTVELGLLGDVSIEIKAGLTEGEEVLSVGR